MQNYHKHSYYSNIWGNMKDSSVSNEGYAKRAVELNHKIISSVEHGWQGYYYETFELAKTYNLKFIFGTEAYWVKNREDKDKSNNHIIILAKNETGRRAINNILSEANETGYYLRPRLDLGLILSLPADDVFITTACIAFWRYEDIEDIILKFRNHFKDNFMLEIQYHNTEEQIKLNKKILELSNKYNIEMIVGLDSHYIYPEQKIERDDLLKDNKISFDTDENGWYMDYPNDETVIERFIAQGVFSKDQIIKAMNNTDICLTFEDIYLNDDIKLPTLYPDKTQKEKNKIYCDLILEKFKEYTKDFDIETKKKYFEEIKKEVSVYINTKMVDYPLIDYQIVKEAVKNGGIITDTGRGCFTSDALIWTKNNIKTIDTINIGDEVLSSDGLFHKVLNTFEYDINEDMIEFEYYRQGSSNKKYKNICTLDHNILVNRDGVIKFINAKNLQINDLLCCPKIKNEHEYDEDIIIDLNDYNIFGFKFDNEYIYEEKNRVQGYKYSSKWFSDKKIVSSGVCLKISKGLKIKETSKKKLLDNSPFKTLENYKRYFQKHSKYTLRIKRFIKLNCLWNCFLGLMYSDGWTAKELGIGLAVNRTSKKYFNRYVFDRILRDILPCDYEIASYENKSKNRNLDQLFINSKVLYNLFATEFFKSKKGKDKIFNSKYLNQSTKNLKFLLMGMQKSDGSINKKENKICYDSTSLSLISTYKYLDNIVKKETPLALDVRLARIDDRGYNNKESYKVRRPIVQSRVKLTSNSDYWFLPVTKIINHKNKKCKVYDISVENNHTYVINNIIVHNSAVSYFTNSLCGFSKVDRITSPIKVYPERFISESRILQTRSLPDLDINVGNQEIFAQAQEKIMGKGHAYPMIAFQTMKKKSAFKMYARIENVPADISNQITKQIALYEETYKNAEDDEKEMIDIYDYIDEEYHKIFKQSEKYQGIISGKNQAPCAYLLYSGDIRSEIGLIRCKSESTKKEVITTVTDGMVAEKYKFLKNDLLKVDVVLLISKVYKRIGIHHHSVNELIEIINDNEKVWDIYAKGITIGINQCESIGTTQKVMRYKPKNLSELSAFIAGIRPSFKSMYKKFESREPFSYGIKALDNLLQTKEFPQSFILYQEQIMNVLNYSGFPMDECYGIIKAVAKKHPEKVLPLKDKFLKGFKAKIIADDNVSEEKAEETSKQVWQILSDFCAYGFNASHSLCMALDSLYCAYLKSHYPYEFYEVLLQHYSDKGNKDKANLLKIEMKKYFNISEGKYKFGLDNTKFTLDKENNCINPSLSSIKNFNSIVSEELYSLSQTNTYNNFIELLKDIKTKTRLNISQIKILIKLNYFCMFGKTEKILNIHNLFEKYYDKKNGVCINKSQINKSKLTDEEFKIIPKYAKETAELYKFTDIDGFIKELCNNIEDKELPLSVLISAQAEYLGYIDIVVSKLKNFIYILDIDTKYSPKLTCYKIDTGETVIIKMDKKSYNDSDIEKGCIVQCTTIYKPKMKKVDGEWICSSETELWINKYKIISKPKKEKEI